MEHITLHGMPGIASLGGGHGHPLVFLHGAWDDHRGFEGYVEYFGARGWDAYAFSRRGRLGLPPDRCEGVRVEDYVDDTLAAIADIGGGGQPIVIGHSLGGLVAQAVAERGGCAAAVLIEPGPPKGIPLLPKLRTWGVFLRLTPRIALGRPFLPSLRPLGGLGSTGCRPSRQPSCTPASCPNRVAPSARSSSATA